MTDLFPSISVRPIGSAELSEVMTNLAKYVKRFGLTGSRICHLRVPGQHLSAQGSLDKPRQMRVAREKSLQNAQVMSQPAAGN